MASASRELLGGVGYFHNREDYSSKTDDQIDPEVAKADEVALGALTDFSLKVDIIDPETLREQSQNKGNGLLHPLADRVGNWLRGFQRRRSRFTAT